MFRYEVVRAEIILLDVSLAVGVVLGQVLGSNDAAAGAAERGFHGVGVDEIGAAVGISGPGLYRHFAGKDAMLAELLAGISERLLDGGRLRVEEAGTGPESVLASQCRRTITSALARLPISARSRFVTSSDSLCLVSRTSNPRSRRSSRSARDTTQAICTSVVPFCTTLPAAVSDG